MPLFWVMKEDPITAEQHREYGSRGQLGIVNAKELKSFLREFYLSLPGGSPYCQRLPENLPRAQIKMPSDPVVPDYFRNNNLRFVSANLRQAIGSNLIEEDAVQYFPIQLIEGSAEAAAQDYHLMHIRSAQPAMDVEKSDCKAEEIISRKTKEPYLSISYVKKLVLRQDIPAKLELFRVKEDPTTILAADSLAQRILEAHCSNVMFYEPASAFNYLKGVRRYKTLAGIGPPEK